MTTFIIFASLYASVGFLRYMALDLNFDKHAAARSIFWIIEATQNVAISAWCVITRKWDKGE